MSRNFKVDSTIWKAKSKRLVKELKLDEADVVREQAGLLAQLMTKVAPPFKAFPKLQGKPTYTTGGALGVGRKAVKAGFFAAVKRMGTERQWDDKNIKKAIRAGDTDYLTRRLRYMKRSNKHNLEVFKYSDQRRDSKRNNRGRVNKGTQPFVGIQNKDVNAGLRRAMDNVGIAKASLALIALRLGRPAPPAWIKKHFGKVNPTLSISRKPARVTFRTSAKGLDVVANNLKRIERFRMTAMVKRLESMIRANAKKSGFKVKR